MTFLATIGLLAVFILVSLSAYFLIGVLTTPSRTGKHVLLRDVLKRRKQ